ANLLGRCASFARPHLVKSVLFVCTGNVCRSPIAEGLFRRLLGNRKDIEVASAGVHAVRGQPPSSHAIEVCAEEGADIGNLRSQPLTGEVVVRSGGRSGGASTYLMSNIPHSTEPSLTAPSGGLRKVDPEVYDAVAAEEKRQRENIELIASENFTSRAVMEAQGSVLTNKY